MKKPFWIPLLVLFFLCIYTRSIAIDYTVKPNDTLWLIANQYGLSVQQLIKSNPEITDSSKIVVGQVITIPSPKGREVLTYLYAGTTVSYLKSLNDTNGAISTICVDYFDISSTGNLLITPIDKIDPAFISQMQKRGVMITPFISNHWNRAVGVAALNNRELLSTQIADQIEKYNLDGINVDIENVTELHRSAYTDFVRLLRQKIPNDKVVSVAVAANPKGWTTGWHGSYDYRALASHSDYLMLMCYDESYQGGLPGPISSNQFLKDSILYALNNGVAKSKVVLGIPFFGRYWKEGDAIGGYGIAARDVDYLIATYASNTLYDEATQSTKTVITIGKGEAKPKLWGGKTLSEGTYTIWYDNARSVQHKLETIQQYDLKGSGSWALGQENIGIWDSYVSLLNGKELPEDTTPIPIPVTPPPIDNLARLLSILNQFGNTRVVKSDTVLSKGEVAVLLSELCYLDLEPNGVTFSDTTSYWGKGQVNALKRRGIIKGADNNMYQPNKRITREELVTILERVLVLPNTIDFYDISFKDVSPSMWSYYPIAKLNFFNLVIGVNKDSFRPLDTITAGTMSIILDRIYKYEYPMNADKYMEKIDPLGRSFVAPLYGDPTINPR